MKSCSVSLCSAAISNGAVRLGLDSVYRDEPCVACSSMNGSSARERWGIFRNLARRIGNLPSL